MAAGAGCTDVPVSASTATHAASKVPTPAGRNPTVAATPPQQSPHEGRGRRERLANGHEEDGQGRGIQEQHTELEHRAAEQEASIAGQFGRDRSRLPEHVLHVASPRQPDRQASGGMAQCPHDGARNEEHEDREQSRQGDDNRVQFVLEPQDRHRSDHRRSVGQVVGDQGGEHGRGDVGTGHSVPTQPLRDDERAADSDRGDKAVNGELHDRESRQDTQAGP